MGTPFSPEKWLAQGTGDEAGSVLEPDFFLISKKALEFSFEKPRHLSFKKTALFKLVQDFLQSL